MGLITITEANAALPAEVFTEWDDIPDDPIKQYHIDRASAWVRNNWDYPSDSAFDWDDDTTWVAGTKDLIAEYADAVRGGLIYATGAAGSASTAPVKRTKQKVGSLETETEYAQPDTGQGRETPAAVDDQMIALGYERIGGPGTLRRV